MRAVGWPIVVLPMLLVGVAVRAQVIMSPPPGFLDAPTPGIVRPPPPADYLGASPAATDRIMSPPPGFLRRLPSAMATPPVGNTPRGFLLGARQALTAGLTAAAREALEMAETRVLTRSILASLRRLSSHQSVVMTIDDARVALDDGDRAMALQKIDTALRDPDLDDPAE